MATKQINPKCLLSKEISYKANKTCILQSSPTFSLVHDPQNAVVTDRIGESFRTNQRKQKEMPAQWLRFMEDGYKHWSINNPKQHL